MQLAFSAGGLVYKVLQKGAKESAEPKPILEGSPDAPNASEGRAYKFEPELKFLLIRAKSLKGQPIWALPKGTIEKGETVEAAATREVEEETGVKVEIGEKLKEVEYFFKRDNILYKKKVYFFLMKYLSGEIKPQLSEIEDAAWLSAGEAREKMSYANEKEILDKALEHISRNT